MSSETHALIDKSTLGMVVDINEIIFLWVQANIIFNKNL
jgi:hypothetical protein